MGNGPQFTQNGRMCAISSFQLGTAGCVHSRSGDLAAHGSDRGRGPRATRARAVVICARNRHACADAPGWTRLIHRRAACVGPRAATRIHTCTSHAQIMLQLRMCMRTWPPSQLCNPLPFLAARSSFSEFSPPLNRGMRDQARAVRRVLLPMRVGITHNGLIYWGAAEFARGA